jgi:hypothetical protein
MLIRLVSFALEEYVNFYSWIMSLKQTASCSRTLSGELQCFCEILCYLSLSSVADLYSMLPISFVLMLG